MPDKTIDVTEKRIMRKKRQAVLDRISPIIIEKLKVGITDVTEDKNLDTDLLSDSLDAAAIIMEVEDEFQIGIPEETVSRIQTIGDMVTAIIELQSK